VKLLFIGDIVGRPGRHAVKELVPKLRETHGIQFVIANGENSAGGNGITPDTAREIFAAGVDVITSGDHLWDQKEVMELLANEKRFLRPLNYPPETPGKGAGVFPVHSPQSTVQSPISVGVLNLQGRTFMPPLENPFLMAREEVARLRQQTKIIFVDFHAEATSEKIALARMLDGQVSAVVGTHTHVQTADERILPEGTAYLSDLGMTGSYAGVIGMNKSDVIARFTSVTAKRADHASGQVRICAAVIDVDETTGRAKTIDRLSLTHDQ